VLARLGGDEFGIILQNVSRDGIRRIAETFCALLADYTFKHAAHEFGVSASVGAALMDKNSESPEQALAWADSASYRAKKHGGAGARLYGLGDETDAA